MSEKCRLIESIIMLNFVPSFLLRALLDTQRMALSCTPESEWPNSDMKVVVVSLYGLCVDVTLYMETYLGRFLFVDVLWKALLNLTNFWRQPPTCLNKNFKVYHKYLKIILAEN